MSEETQIARDRLLEKLKSNVTSEEVVDAIDALIESRIADILVLMADRSEQLLGVRL